MKRRIYRSIDDYILSFPKATQKALREMRAIVRKEAPQAQEKISYQMPTFFLNGNLVHFAGYEKHVGFYPTPSAIATFKSAVSLYKYAKGSVQFPLDEPLPKALIARIVRFRVKENANPKK